MQRYSKIAQKDCREIVLLKAFPCLWSKCRFCDYILDNDRDETHMAALNHEVLSQITGEYGVLEVIDSASFFELPSQTIEEIFTLIQTKKIHTLYIESHYLHRQKIADFKKQLGIRVIIKSGIETFDDDFRNRVLNKNVHFQSIEELKTWVDSPCLMVGIQGQTKAMIERDMAILTSSFEHGTISLYRNNTTPIKRDQALIDWFKQTYAYLKEDPRYDYLDDPTDFGVGD